MYIFKLPVLCLVFWACLTLCHPMDRQAPLSMGFSRQEHWRGLPFPSPVRLPNPGVEPRSPALQVDSFFLKFIYFNWRLITILQWFLPYTEVASSPSGPPGKPLNMAASDQVQPLYTGDQDQQVVGCSNGGPCRSSS